MKVAHTYSNRIKTSTGEKIFTVFNYTFITVLCLVMLYPFWHVVMQSFSSMEATLKGGVFLYPKGFNLDTYRSVFNNPQVYTGFATSIMVTVIGTVLGTLLTAMTAYPLSKSRLRGGKVLMVIVLITMIFAGGMIPSFLLIQELGLMDNRLALILPALVSAYNCIIMKNFFMSIPESLEESARIDGANDIRIFFSIIVPLSKATIATSRCSWPLLTGTTTSPRFCTSVHRQCGAVARRCFATCWTNTQQAMAQAGVNVINTSNTNSETIKAGTIVISTVPILVVYPFVQKYFVTGVMIGGVKG